MKSAILRSALADLSGKPGFVGSALVNIEDGMVWHAVGSVPELESLASASSNYWRLNTRTQSSFDDLGPLQIAILIHRLGQLTMCECGKGMLLTVVTERRDTGYLAELKSAHPKIAKLVNDI
jgi:predicted regulator of Ras-like GTPase activity (Roadblock/LC7/MglB family)